MHATKCSTSGFLHGQGGFEGCLSNSASVGRVPLSLVLSKQQRTGATISDPSIWILHLTIQR